jgi:hypothetical protein
VRAASAMDAWTAGAHKVVAARKVVGAHKVVGIEEGVSFFMALLLMALPVRLRMVVSGTPRPWIPPPPQERLRVLHAWATPPPREFLRRRMAAK